MNRRTIGRMLSLLMAASMGTATGAEPQQLETSIGWSDFLSRHDLQWDRMPETWNEAPFLGNGMMGTMVRQVDSHTVRWDVGRGDVQDHRPGNALFDTSRLPIGYFKLHTVGAITRGTIKLDLWNAEATGEIQTDKGTIKWQSLVHAESMLMLTTLDPTIGERGCHWEWNPLPAVSPRITYGRKQPGYKQNPPSVEKMEGPVNVCTQPLHCGGETATAWTLKKQGGRSVLMVSVAHSYPKTTATRDAVEMVTRNRAVSMDTLIDNVPEKYRSDSAGIFGATGQHCRGEIEAPDGKNAPSIGHLLWACHNCWLHYRHTMDDAVLREQLFPLLRRAVNFHFHFLSKDKDGTLHFPKTLSPEYNSKQGPDTNYDLALLRWGCGALIEACGRLEINDPRLPRWREVQQSLAGYPINKNGYMIAAGVPFAHGHRHYSHMLMLYPLYLVNVEHEGAKKLAVRSVRHWQSLGALQGYSLTGASSISSAFGLGNDALKFLNGLKPGVFQLDIRKGEEAILWSGDTIPDFKIALLPADTDKRNSFGLR